jgi:hypothetical protein
MLNHSEDLGVEKDLQTNFITMDIETITLNSKITPYLICAYGPAAVGGGNMFIESYANSTLDQKDLFTSFIYKLLTFFNESKTLTIYAHNFAKFDGLFILKHLIPFGIVEPLVFNGKLITIKFKIMVDDENEISKFNGKTIIFKDSYLLLPVALRELAITYKCTENKGIFPFKLNDINYNGVFPRFEYFKDINIVQYLLISQTFVNKIWNFRDESIKYCKLDCVILHEVLIL